MFLLVSVRHVGAHPGEHQHGVSIQISINLGKTFLRIRSIPLIWILCEGLCVFTSFHFPDSRLYLLNGFDFYFDLFWMAWLKTSNKNLRIRDIRWSRNLRAVCWCRGEALKVRKLPLRLSAGVVCRPPPVFKRNLGRRKKLAEKVGRRKIYSPVPPPSKNNWWHGG